MSARPPADAADHSVDEHHPPTKLLSPEEANRVRESTMPTADYHADALPGATPDVASVAPEPSGADAKSEVPAAQREPQRADTVHDAGPDARASEDHPTLAEQGVPPTARETNPARTNDLALAAGDDRAALDAKIRAHLDESRPSDSGVDPLLGALIGGRFEVISKLGAGGMGAVYRAKQRGIDRQVAVKVLLQELASNETLIRRFTIEALAVSRLKHPNTIQIYDFGKTEQGNLYIAMELLEGETLYARHKRQRRLPIRHALRIIAQVAASLAEAHGKGIIHRDLKPENIFLTRVGDDPDFVKVLDFGVAKLRDGAGDGKGTLTKAGSIFGTPRYMSPEQASARPIDARSDVYALGVILYELIVGHAPFQSETPITLLLAHVNDEPPSPSAACPDLAIPLEVEELILTLLEKSPDDRIQSAAELAQLCSSIAAHLPAAFEQPVKVDEAQALGVALSAPATVHIPMEGLASDTVQTGGAPTSVDRPEPPTHPKRWPLVVLFALLFASGVGGVVWWQSAQRGGAAGGAGDAAGVHTNPGARAPVAAAGGALAMAGGADASGASPAGDAVTVDTGPRAVRVQVVTVPAGANVLRLGEPAALLGSTPLALSRSEGTKVRVRLERDGYVPQEMELNFAESTTLRVVLAPRPAPTRPTAKATKPPSRRRPRRKPRTTRKPMAAAPKATPQPTKPQPAAAKSAAKPKPAKKPNPGLVDDLM